MENHQWAMLSYTLTLRAFDMLTKAEVTRLAAAKGYAITPEEYRNINAEIKQVDGCLDSVEILLGEVRERNRNKTSTAGLPSA